MKTDTATEIRLPAVADERVLFDLGELTEAPGPNVLNRAERRAQARLEASEKRGKQ